MKKAHERSHHRNNQFNRLSPRNGFTVSFVLSPVTGLFLPPSPADQSPPT
jgi:hypothetical protein